MSRSATANVALSHEYDRKYAWEVLIIVMIGTLMSALDSSIVNVAIPSMMAGFGVSVDDMEWVVTGYMLSFATLMPVTSWLKGRIGTKNLYIISLITFTVGSLLCGMSWSLPTLIIARVIQAAGGGALTPIGMSMISDAFPIQERGKAIGYWGIGVIMGPAFGPALGGYLTEVFGWRSIFLVNLPVGIIGVMMAAAWLRRDEEKHEKQPFDFWGFGFLGVFLVSFLLGMSKGEEKGWHSPYEAWCLIFSVLGFIGFLMVELNTKYGIIDLMLFKKKIFAASMVISVIRAIAMFGGTFLLPLFLENVQFLDEIRTGLYMLPGALIIALVMPFAGKLGDRIGPFIPTFIGLLLLAYFYYLYRYLDVTTSSWDVIGPTLIRGIGVGLMMAPSMSAALNSVPKASISMASTMLNLMQQVGGAMGIAFLSMVMDHRTHFHMANSGSAMQVNSPEFQNVLHHIMEQAHMLGYSVGNARLMASVLIAKHAALISEAAAFDDAFLVGMVIILLGVALTFLLPKKPVHAVTADGEAIIME